MESEKDVQYAKTRNEDRLSMFVLQAMIRHMLAGIESLHGAVVKGRSRKDCNFFLDRSFNR